MTCCHWNGLSLLRIRRNYFQALSTRLEISILGRLGPKYLLPAGPVVRKNIYTIRFLNDPKIEKNTGKVIFAFFVGNFFIG